MLSAPARWKKLLCKEGWWWCDDIKSTMPVMQPSKRRWKRTAKTYISKALDVNNAIFIHKIICFYYDPKLIICIKIRWVDAFPFFLCRRHSMFYDFVHQIIHRTHKSIFFYFPFHIFILLQPNYMCWRCATVFRSSSSLMIRCVKFYVANLFIRIRVICFVRV